MIYQIIKQETVAKRILDISYPGIEYYEERDFMYLSINYDSEYPDMIQISRDEDAVIFHSFHPSRSYSLFDYIVGFPKDSSKYLVVEKKPY